MAPEKKSVIGENFFKLFFTVNNWITVDCHSKSSWWPYNWFCWMRHRLWSRKRSSQKHHSYISKSLVNFQGIITLTLCNFHLIGPLHWADSVSQKHPLPEVVETCGRRTYSYYWDMMSKISKKKIWHRCYYPYRSRELVSPVCVFFFNCVITA